MNVYLLLNGDYAAPQIPPRADDLIIAVDGGARWLAQLKRRADFLIGDFDSLPAELRPLLNDIPCEQYPRDKDATDLELALHHVRVQRRIRPQSWQIIAGFGGETDHAFANLWVLAACPEPVIIYGQPQNSILLPADIILDMHGPIGSLVSVFALETTHDLNYQGLRYPLEHAQIIPHSALTARNRTASPHARIHHRQGKILIYTDSALKLKLSPLKEAKFEANCASPL